MSIEITCKHGHKNSPEFNDDYSWGEKADLEINCKEGTMTVRCRDCSFPVDQETVYSIKELKVISVDKTEENRKSLEAMREDREEKERKTP